MSRLGLVVPMGLDRTEQSEEYQQDDAPDKSDG